MPLPAYADHRFSIIEGFYGKPQATYMVAFLYGSPREAAIGFRTTKEEAAVLRARAHAEWNAYVKDPTLRPAWLDGEQQ